MTVAPVSTIDADFAVLGSGFAGSLVALALRQRNRRVVLVERGRHPRFVRDKARPQPPAPDQVTEPRRSNSLCPSHDRGTTRRGSQGGG